VVAKKKARAIAFKTTAPKAKKGAARYNPQTGKLTGRAASAQERLEQLAEQYQADGMSIQDARQRARDVMRNNPKMDWRRG
jgi:hypothetical protein